MRKVPTQLFNLHTVSLIFFDQDAAWLRHKDKNGFLVDEEGQIGVRKENGRGDRLYSLEDVKRIALRLFSSGIIDEVGLVNCVARIESMYKPVFSRKRRKLKKP